MKRIFDFVFPGSYGGAVSEMHHQILLWLDMGVEVHLIPAWNPAREPLYPSMRDLGVIIHAPLDWTTLSPEDSIIGFCIQLFLSYLPDILPYSRRTVSLGCMTWLMDEENRQALSLDKRSINRSCFRAASKRGSRATNRTTNSRTNQSVH